MRTVNTKNVRLTLRCERERVAPRDWFLLVFDRNKDRELLMFSGWFGQNDDLLWQAKEKSKSPGAKQKGISRMFSHTSREQLSSGFSL